MSEAKLQIVYFVFLSLVLRTKSYSYCTNTYGIETCSFLPAPPGKTPPCALPGLTYCEHPEHYPGERIQYLTQKWRYDHSTFLIDESKEDFTSYIYPAPSYKYGPPNTINYPEPIYIPKPNYVYNQSPRVGNSYIPPHPSQFSNSYNATQGYPQGHPGGQLQYYKYSSDIPPAGSVPREVYGPPDIYTSLTLPQINTYINKVWNRKDEKYGKTVLVRKRRSENGTSVHDRRKRQSAISGQTLCTSRSQFIMPRAALNNKGNWMYVVNMPELDNRLSQLVKSETCASQTCSGLCGLPVGYTSRCEQKYVQKRLVALEGSGNDLYTDVFWFPSCCVCTISNG